MNKATSSRIDHLIKSSGLFSLSVKQDKYISDFDFSNETILITGAAGSIGSELSKQLMQCEFKKLILIDIAESPLYSLIKELESHSNANIKFVLLNINDRIALNCLFEKYRPSMIFHTAAYKHVPLMEQNPYEAVKTNIFGTKNLAELSIKYLAKKFVFISTDKAVDPISIMGTTKAISEKYLRGLNLMNTSSFTIIRFGNIIGSNGSLLPLLKKQIEAEAPITITSKETSRFFITRQSACYLTLMASTFERTENDTFILEMGSPIKITDIVNRVLLTYENTNLQVKIKYIGLRQGEKLHEKLISKDETIQPSENKNIFIIKSKINTERKVINFSYLKDISPFYSNAEIKSILNNFYKSL
ncbi:SDR family NAD(P)-dependent oxidoreductase [uncultured Algibacter sp.]|uniref:SDR family NAD(P)-dependent oxidoreductase n=1 Tax=uncultured Algibacter sp. TaxID=298659 RepID=UPI00262F1D66|nr:SDR family NAD(P)-dependent oxidoreductase [uncultured Algibacter sp.]